MNASLNNAKMLAAALTGRPPVNYQMEEMREALEAAIEFIDRFSDMVATEDGDEPNEALSLVSWMQGILDRT